MINLVSTISSQSDLCLRVLGRFPQKLLSIPGPARLSHPGPSPAPSSHTATSSVRQKLGKLGIPIDDDDDEPTLDTEDERLILEYQLAQDEEFGRASLRGLPKLRGSSIGPSESDTESLAGNAPASLGKARDIKEAELAAAVIRMEGQEESKLKEEGDKPGLDRHPSAETAWSDQSYRDIVSSVLGWIVTPTT